MDDTIGVERSSDAAELVFQFPSGVVDFSSQYELDTVYLADNIIGRPMLFPRSGVCPRSFAMRTYGRWNDLAPSRKCPIMPQTSAQIISEDYIIVSFETPVIPLVISIFETYAPGSVVRISGKVVNAPEVGAWRLLWQGLPQICNIRRARLFVPKLNYIREQVKELCIEFNHSQLNYHAQLDGVSLGGVLKLPENGELEDLSIPLFNHLRCTDYGFTYDTNEKKNQDVPKSTSLDPFLKPINSIDESEWAGVLNVDQASKLPDETLMNIFSYLDLKSLRLCMRVCKRFNKICKDGFLYRELNFKPYWLSFSRFTLRSFEQYCSRLTKLDLSWCGIIEEKPTSFFIKFIKKCGNLTHLRLDNCGFVNDITFITINSFCKRLKELSLRNCTSINFDHIPKLRSFLEMEHIDFYKTTIDTHSLEFYLMSMPKLKHINISMCSNLDMDRIANMFAIYNKKLVSIDFNPLTLEGLRYFTVLNDLEEINLGWWWRNNWRYPDDSLAAIARACPKLKKIVLVSLKILSDSELLSFANNCPLLEHVNLAGLRLITADACSELLMRCEHLRFLDVNFCDCIDETDVCHWRNSYPQVSIQFSRDRVLM